MYLYCCNNIGKKIKKNFFYIKFNLKIFRAGKNKLYEYILWFKIIEVNTLYCPGANI